MDLKLNVSIEDHGNAGLVASIDSIKGLVVTGNTMQEICKELIISLKVKVAHDLGIPAAEIKDITPEEAEKMMRRFNLNSSKENCQKEISVSFH